MICTKCKIEKDNNFRESRKVCKDCERIESREYYRSRSKRDLKWKEIRAIREKKRRKSKPELFLFLAAKQRAKKQGLEFNIERADIVVPELCPVLKIKLSVNDHQMDSSPTLDRIDNRKGYVKGNICVISWRANNLKSFGTLEDFENIVMYLREKMRS